MELFDTHFVYFGQVLAVSGMKLLVLSNRIHTSGKINHNRTYTIFKTLTPKWKQTSDYECTHQMELFHTHFVYFGQVLAVSGMKLLVLSNRYIQVVKSQPYLHYF